MKSLKISQKLSLAFLIIGLGSVLLVSIIFYFAFKEALIDRTSAQLSSINVLKKTQMEHYFKNLKRDIQILAQDPRIVSVIAENNTGEMEELGDLEKLSGKLLAIYDKNYKLLFTNADPSLEKILRREIKNNSINKVIFDGIWKYNLIDYEADIAGKDVILVGSNPVRNKEGQNFGVLVVLQSFSGLEEILLERTGMGSTGESYIVGSDFYMKSPSRFITDSRSPNILVRTDASLNAFSEKGGTGIINDYRNVPVISAFRKLEVEEVHWVIISEIDMFEAMQPVFKVRNFIAAIALLIMALIVPASLILSRSISRPILKLKDVILKLSKGEVPDQNIDTSAKNEIGEMVKALNQLINSISRTSHFAKEVGNGDFHTHFRPLSDKDMLGQALLQMKDKLKVLKEKEEIMNRQRATGLLEGQEKERKRIAMELHDGLGQLITAAKFKVGLMESQPELQDDLKKILDETITEVKRISNNLMPKVLIDFGLESALKMLAHNTFKHTRLPVLFQYVKVEDGLPLSFDISIGIYRIAQEALNNVVKYARASRVELLVNVYEDKIIMKIRDDGVGFNLPNYLKHKEKEFFGIRNMTERAKLMEGSLTIQSRENSGTEIIVEVPIEQELSEQN